MNMTITFKSANGNEILHIENLLESWTWQRVTGLVKWWPELCSGLQLSASEEGDCFEILIFWKARRTSKKQQQIKILEWQFQTSLFRIPASDGEDQSPFPGNPALQNYWPVQKWFAWHLAKDWKLPGWVICKRMDDCNSVWVSSNISMNNSNTKNKIQQGKPSSPWERFYKTFTQNCFPFISQHCCSTQWPSLSRSQGSAVFLW